MSISNIESIRINDDRILSKKIFFLYIFFVYTFLYICDYKFNWETHCDVNVIVAF